MLLRCVALAALALVVVPASRAQDADPPVGWTSATCRLDNTRYWPVASARNLAPAILREVWQGPLLSPLLTGDINGDGALEIVGCRGAGPAGRLCAISADGELLWEAEPVHDAAVTDPAAHIGQTIQLADLDGNGLPELLVGVDCRDPKNPADKPAAILSYDGAGEFAGGFPLPDCLWASPTCLVGPTGEVAVVVRMAWTKDRQGVFVFAPDGTCTGGTQLPQTPGPLAVADVNDDGAPELVVGREVAEGPPAATPGGAPDASQVIVLDLGGQVLWQTQVGTGATDCAVADVDGDRAAEVVVLQGQSGDRPGDSGIHVLSADEGVPLASVQTSPDASWLGWSVADLDGDGSSDVVSGSTDGTLRFTNARTSFVFQTDQQVRVHAAADVDGDGLTEALVSVGSVLIAVDEHLQELFTYDVGTPIKAAVVSDLNADGVNDVLVCARSLHLLECVAESAADDPMSLAWTGRRASAADGNCDETVIWSDRDRGRVGPQLQSQRPVFKPG